jgi:hypothetical protein
MAQRLSRKRTQWQQEREEGRQEQRLDDLWGGLCDAHQRSFRRCRLFIPGKQLCRGDLMGDGLRRIVKREFVLEAPSEDAQRQAHEDKGAPRETSPRWRRRIHSDPNFEGKGSVIKTIPLNTYHILGWGNPGKGGRIILAAREIEQCYCDHQSRTARSQP